MKFLLIGLMTLTAASSAEARRLDLTKPEDVIAAEVRLNCAPDPNRPRMSAMTGRLYSQRMGEQNRHLFDVQAVNTRACVEVNDPKRGPGYRSVTREIMFYLDPATGRIMDTWINPWTGETVEVIHMFNDPVNMRSPKHAYDETGKPVAWDGTIVNGQAISRRATPFFRDSPMGGAYQDYVGNKYAVMEMSTTVIPADIWLDTAKKGPVPATSMWVRTSPWLPWMKMAGREGSTVLTSVWVAVGSLDEVPEPARSAIRTTYPDYAKAPPLDDARESVFSWQGMKQAIDARAR
jgi:hypothetical protein